MCLFKVINKKKFVCLVYLFSIYIVTNQIRKKTSVGEGLFNQKSRFVQTLFPQKDFQMKCLK